MQQKWAEVLQNYLSYDVCNIFIGYMVSDKLTKKKLSICWPFCGINYVQYKYLYHEYKYYNSTL